MYGLVNKAIEQMVCTHFDTATWEAIKRRAGVDVGVFLSMHAYPDDVTYRLVDAASKTIERSHAEVLRAFGRYWTLYTVAEGYGELLKLTGASLRESLRNLATCTHALASATRSCAHRRSCAPTCRGAGCYCITTPSEKDSGRW